jgi:hypothetical protein
MDPTVEGAQSAARARRRQQRLSTVQNPLIDPNQTLLRPDQTLLAPLPPRVLPALDAGDLRSDDVFNSTQQRCDSFEFVSGLCAECGRDKSHTEKEKICSIYMN